MIKKKLAIIIKSIRKEQGMSQATLAHKAGIDRSYVSILELGNSSPSLGILVCISAALGWKLSELVKAAENGTETEHDLQIKGKLPMVEKTKPTKTCRTCKHDPDLTQAKTGMTCRLGEQPKDDEEGNCLGWEKSGVAGNYNFEDSSYKI